jgi:hypothetical protein
MAMSAGGSFWPALLAAQHSSTPSSVLLHLCSLVSAYFGQRLGSDPSICWAPACVNQQLFELYLPEQHAWVVSGTLANTARLNVA